MKMGKIASFISLTLIGCIAPLAMAQSEQEISLQEILKQAVKQDLRILQAEHALTTAKNALTFVKDNLFLPRLSLSAMPLLESTTEPSHLSGTISLNAGFTLPIGTSLSAGYNTTYSYKDGQILASFSASLTQPLFQDLSLTSVALDIQQKEAAFNEAKWNLKQTKNQVILDAFNAYFDLFIAQEMIHVAAQRVELAQKILGTTQSKTEQGQVGRVDLLSAQIDFRQQQLDLAKLRSSHTANREKFFGSLGMTQQLRLLAPPIEFNSLKISAETLIKQESRLTPDILQNDADVRRWGKELQAAALNLRKIQQERLPQTALRASFDGNNNWGLRLDWSWSFFSGFDAKLRDAEKNLELIHRGLESAQKTAKIAIASQREALQTARDELDLFAMKRELLTLQKEIRQKQRESGLLSQEDWERFLIEQIEFENNYRRSAYNLALAYLRYQASLGIEITLKEVTLEQNP